MGFCGIMVLVMAVYENLRNLREENNLSQKELAKELSIAQTTYSNYELGKINIPVPTLIRLAEYYHTTVDYLLGLTDDRNEKKEI